MMASLNLDCNLSAGVIPVGEGPRLVYLLVDITGGEGARALPSNLGFIIDTSDSMRIRLVTDDQFAQLARDGKAKEVMTDGVPAYQITSISNEMMSAFPRRIDYVSQALIIASEYLRPADRFSLIAFAGKAHRMIPSVTGKERMRLQQAARELEFLQLGDGTHLAQGIAMAFAEVQDKSNDTSAGRLILLTDGHTRKVSECYQWAKRAREAGITLSTMGIGVEFNEDLLIPLADLTGGHAYYIESPDKIPEAFRQELGSAMRISYHNVEVKVRLANGVALRRVHRVLPEMSAFDQGPNMDDSYALQVGDYDPAAPVSLLLELVVPPWQEGSFKVAQVLLAWDSLESGLARQNKRQEITALRSNTVTAPLNGRVMKVVEKVGAYKMGTKALEKAQDAGKSTDPEEKGVATVRLRQAATRLLDLGEDSLADAMFQQAEMLESSGSMDAEAAKKLRYETRRLSQRL